MADQLERVMNEAQWGNWRIYRDESLVPESRLAADNYVAIAKANDLLDPGDPHKITPEWIRVLTEAAGPFNNPPPLLTAEEQAQSRQRGAALLRMADALASYLPPESA